MLQVKNLHASADGHPILRGVDLEIQAGEVHALMGPNGSGKSTLAHVISGRPGYEVTAGSITYEGKDLLEMSPEKRACEGIFLAFQYPVEIPGVNNTYFLRAAVNAIRKYRNEDEVDAVDFLKMVKDKAKLIEIDETLVKSRPVNAGFSGGEKKRNEIFQMAMLEPRFAVLDETDSGLDIDALRIVANGVNALRSKDRAMLVVTHYQRLLDYIVPDHVHVLADGQIVRSGGRELALELEAKGYSWLEKEPAAATSGGDGVTTATTTMVDHHVETFERLTKELPGGWPGARLDSIRRAAIDRFAELGFPTTKLEAWKYTSVAPIARVAFEPAVAAPSDLAAATLAATLLPGLDGGRLRFVNGHHVPEPGIATVLPPGVELVSLGAALAAAPPPEWLATHLARMVADGHGPFAALNTAFMLDGACLLVRRGVVCPDPIHLSYVSAPTAGDPLVSHPRTLIIAEAGSQLSIVETHTSAAGDLAYFSNAVTEVFLGPGSIVEHVKLQTEAATAFHVATLEARLERDSRFTSRSFALGAAISRFDINVVQAATGVECILDGLFVGAGSQHVDHHTTVDHALPYGTSHELYKGILDGRSTGVFNGRVLVRPDAQKTDSRQASRNLLLSRDATIETKPELEIFADDVKCAHGATIGQLDDKALFYLRSRGISHDDARAMLILAFAGEMIDRVAAAPVRAHLSQVLEARLPGAVARRFGADASAGEHA